MNLIKLNPLKKLMLVVLSWFVHAVYHVEVHAWHIGDKVTTVTNTSVFIDTVPGDDDWAKCAGWDEDSGNLYYIFPLNPTLQGAFYVYHPGTNKYSQVPTSGVLCLTEAEFNAMQSFFGNADKNWGNCMAINCCNGQKVSCTVAATCSAVLEGHMFPVLLASDSTMMHGSGFSTAYSYAYAATTVQIPNEGTKRTQRCVLTPGGYIANIPTEVPSSPTTSEAVVAFANTVFKECPAGYYCPGGSSIGEGMRKLAKQYTGRIECPAGHYCSKGVTSATICSAGYYAYSMASSCTHCPSTSQYNPDGVSIVNPSSIGTWSKINATTSDAGAESATECYVTPESPYLLAGEGGVFAYTGACYYS